MNAASRDRHHPAAGATGGVSASIDLIVLKICDRIDGLLVEEKSSLGAASPDALDRLIDRKEHLALDVSRVVQMSKEYVPAPEVRSRLSRTLASLARHTEHVRRHVEAVRSITAIVSGLYCDATSDGTYDGAMHTTAGLR